MDVKNFRLTLILLMGALLFGCGDRRAQPSYRQTDFPPSQSPREQNPVEQSSPRMDTAPVSRTPEERAEQEALKSAPLLVKGEVTNALPAYRVPEKLEQRLREVNPELVVPSSTKFEIVNQHLHIKLSDKSMTFSGVLRVPGKQEEAIELRCHYDPKSEPWSCDQMYPVNPRVAAERRLQATVNCLDTNRCERVGVEVFVVIGGKTESQLYQNQKFSARRATSGDALEPDSTDGVRKLEKPVPVGQIPPRRRPHIQQKPTPAPSVPAPAPAPEEFSAEPEVPAPTTEAVSAEPTELTENELQEVMEDPNQAIEITAPMPMPRPARGQFSIPGIETLRPESAGGATKAQAIGFHNGGNLRSGNTLPASGPGFICRHRSDRNYGTDMTIQLLEGATAAVDRKFPNQSPIVIANISKQGGGRLCNAGSCHASHQTGLDVDVVFPSRKRVSDMWSLCGSGGCRSGGKISDDFDEERFFQFVKTLVGAQNRPVIAFFIDTQIKRHMCQWARKRGEDIQNQDSPAFRALQAMKHEPGHHNHVHVRFKCPGNRDCRDATVSLGRGSGC